jgi:hypothetical protein
MAAGDLITGATQYEFDAVLMGSGTNYIMESMEGLDDMPELRADDSDRMDDHGSIAGLDLLPARTITATLDVYDSAGHAAIMARYRTLARAMAPSRIELPLVFQRPGEVKKQVFVRPRRRSLPSTYDVAHGLAKGSLAWYAPDPRIYSLIEHSQVITIAAGATSASASISNVGDFRSAPRFTIAGTGTNPRIAVSAQTPNRDGTHYNGRTTAIDYAMGAGDTFAVSSRLKTITLNGAQAYSKKRTDSQWFELMPGTQTITVSRTGTTGTQTYTVYWYDAWL